jgi:hypothetical protein
VGTALLTVCSDADPQRDDVKEILRVEGEWTAEDFARVRGQLKGRNYELDVEKVRLKELGRVLRGQRKFIVGLLENSAVMEHESFTDVLWAVFHVVDELEDRQNLDNLPGFDRGHILGDVQRAYGLLVVQWLRYMQHMQKRYPYLFSRAVRRNPFVLKKSSVLEGLEE